jgi:hypothetical protein
MLWRMSNSGLKIHKSSWESFLVAPQNTTHNPFLPLTPTPTQKIQSKVSLTKVKNTDTSSRLFGYKMLSFKNYAKNTNMSQNYQRHYHVHSTHASKSTIFLSVSKSGYLVDSLELVTGYSVTAFLPAISLTSGAPGFFLRKFEYSLYYLIT